MLSGTRGRGWGLVGVLLFALLLVGSTAPAAHAQSCVPPKKLGVVFILDDSGSMTSSDPVDLRGAATRAGLDRLPDGYVAAASTFSDVTSEIFPPTALDPGSRAAARGRIGPALESSGGTDYDDAFEEALRQLRLMPASVDRRAVIFLSDGLPNSSFTSDRDVIAMGVPIFTLGFGDEANEDVLRDIATRSGGSYHKLDSAADITPTFASITSTLTCDAAVVEEVVTLAPGESRAFPFGVRPGDLSVEGLASWATGDVSLQLVRPDGSVEGPGAAGGGESFQVDPNYVTFQVANPAPGGWQAVLTAGAGAAEGVRVSIQVVRRNAFVDPGPPLPNPDPSCQHQLQLTELVSLIASCLRQQGGVYHADGRVRLNGIDLTAVSGALTFEPASGRVNATGVRVALGPLTLYEGNFTWDVRGSVGITAGARANIKGFPMTGRIAVGFVPQAATLTAHVTLGAAFGAITGDIALSTTHATGLQLDALTIGLRGGDLRLFDKLLIQNASVSYRADQDLWEGQVQIQLPGTGRTIGGVLRIARGEFHSAGLEAGNLNIPLGHALFIQRINAGVQANPFGLSGGIGVSGGPSVRFLGRDISAIAADANLSYTTGPDFDTWKIAGSLSLASFPLANGEIVYRTGLDVEFGGGVRIDLGILDFEASTRGWVESLRRFQAHGVGRASLPGISGEAEGMISNAGVAVCAKRQVLFGSISGGVSWRWGESPRAFIGGCDFSQVEQRRSASVSQTGGRTVRLRGRGRRAVVFAVHGAGGAPALSVAGPRGLAIADPGQGWALTDRAYLLRSPEEATTYVLVNRPPAGRYTFTPADGPTIARVGSVAALPVPRVSARVRGRGSRRALSWRLRRVRGQRVSFIERGPGISRTIVKTNEARGRIRMRPSFGPGGRRTITAVVQQRGLTRQHTTVASFRVRAGRPRKPRRIRIKRGATSLQVFWRHNGRATGFDVIAELRDGRRVLRTVSSRRRRARVPNVPRAASGRVVIVARGLGQGRDARPVRIRLRSVSFQRT